MSDHALHIWPSSPNYLNDVIHLTNEKVTSFIWPMRKLQQEAVFDYNALTLWLRTTNAATKLWFELMCIMTNWSNFLFGRMTWRQSNNWENMVRFGEHGLTWLQSVDRGQALTDYSVHEMASSWWQKAKVVLWNVIRIISTCLSSIWVLSQQHYRTPQWLGYVSHITMLFHCKVPTGANWCLRRWGGY